MYDLLLKPLSKPLPCEERGFYSYSPSLAGKGLGVRFSLLNPLCLGIFLSLALMGCTPNSQPQGNTQPQVVATSTIIADLAEDIPNFSMFELTTEDWENLITWLKEEPIPPRHFQFDLAQFQQGDNWDDDEDFFSAESCLRLFEKENELNTRELAKRAAFPLSLSPNLLYYLRQHQDKNNQAPWYAIADILLSSLVRKIDRELYEMSPDIRKLLLKKLTPEELKSLAYQLQTYIQEQIGDRCSKSVYWQNQQWLALAYLKPSQAVN
jgi:hypothetical protein